MQKQGFKIFIFLIFLLQKQALLSQHLGLNWLFQTGLRATYGSHVAQKTDSLRFSMQNASFSAVLPFGGKAKLEWRELNLSASQSFLQFRAGLRELGLREDLPSSYLYNFSASLTHLRASLNSGFWLYHANLGLLRDIKLYHNNYFFVGALAKIKVKSLHKQDIYGLALSYNFGSFLPIPLLGLNRKLSKNWRMNVLLPIQMAFTYKISPQLDLRCQSYIDFFRSDIQVLEIWTKQSLSLQEVRTGLLLGWNFHKKTKLFVETSWTQLRSLQFWQDTKAQNYPLHGGFYFSANLQINAGKSPINAQIFNNF